jgi:hypothetical protein
VTVLLKHLFEARLAKQMAAAIAELSTIMENEIDERVVDLVADLREQIERRDDD